MTGVERIPVPRAPDAPAPYRFPVVATIAPVVAAVVLWLLTSSPFALVFAALGPVTAIASLVDSRLGARRSARRELSRFETEAAAVRERIRLAHDRERADLAELAPAPGRLVEPGSIDPQRWTEPLGDALPVAAGRADLPSTVALEGADDQQSAVRAIVASLSEEAAVLRDATVVVDARLGIGVVGCAAVATAVARAVVVGVARRLSPAEHWCSAVGAGAQWVCELPHPVGPPPAGATWAVAFGRRGEPPSVLIAVADHERDLPGGCRVVIRVDGRGAQLVRHPDRAMRREIRPELLSQVQAIGWARRASDDAARDALVVDDRALPAGLELAPLLAAPPPPGALACTPGMDAAGPVCIDLVADGPHAVVGGTTGSGKSELLVAWVLAMASAHPPDRVTMLLVDFKGGAAFGALARLPHTVGIVTDLDETGAARALASLRAELRFRERALAQAGARDVGEVAGLPRLVILVDEFAAMLSDRPELHGLFADIAARGRALGVHLVLCTQRPAGVVRDAVLANADLRISLRVNNRADSVAVVGTDAAAELPASARGRGVLCTAAATPRSVQFALAAADDVDAVIARWPDPAPVRRPWLEPLPARVLAEELEPCGPGVPFGLVDLPEEQRRATAHWTEQDGHLLVIGMAGSGKSTALRALGGPDPLWFPDEPAAAWDAIGELERTRERTVLIDDLDALLARFPLDYRAEAVDRLGMLLRTADGLRFAAAAQRVTADLQSLAALLPARVVLRHRSRQDVLLAGGAADDYRDALPPGGGTWRGERLQIVDAPASPRPGVDPVVRPLREGPLAVVSPRAAAVRARLRGAVMPLADAADPASQAAAGVTLLGNVDDWQSRWGALAAVRPHAQVLLDGCSPAEFRALTRSSQLPPLLAGHPGLCWRLEPEGGAVRVRLPLADEAPQAG